MTVWLPLPRFRNPALCAETDPDRWFPEKGGATRDVKQVCRRCEARDECLAWALAKPEHWGVWGGKSEQERQRMRAQLREAS
ncbi:MAG TPA: WhiB family transcriptional regulator [Spirillospora sp.]|nr:WhiB family transcriptional regulator [Spirillospora sp.]